MAEGKRFVSLLPQNTYNQESVVKTSTYGIHDTLRNGMTSVREQSHAAHPLKFAEENYHLNKQKQEFAALRSTQGVHMPMKLQMERAVLSRVQRLPGIESSRASLRTVLDDYDLGFEDMLCGPASTYSLVAQQDAS